MEKYYKILEIHINATEQEVKQAYRDMVKVWHPDRFTHDIKLQKKAEENLKKINDAYQRIVDHLNNSHKRQQSQQYERTEKQEKRASQPPPRQTKPNKLRHLKKNLGWYLFLGLILLGITVEMAWNAWKHRVKNPFDTKPVAKEVLNKPQAVASPSAYYGRGYTKCILQDYTGAIQDYSKAIEL